LGLRGNAYVALHRPGAAGHKIGTMLQHLVPTLCAWLLASAALAQGLPGSSPRAEADDPLPPSVQATLNRLGLPADALAAVAVPLLHPAPAWRFQAGRPMQPGSSMKLLTTIVALDHLGPNHRGFTELRSAAALVAGSLEGDLVIKGGADPELGVPQLWALLLDLRQAGVQHIAGDLLVDRSLFRPARIDQGLPPFDESPEFGYNVIPDALMLAGNLLPMEIKATADGVVASAVPALPGLTLGSRMTLSDAACSAWDDGWLPATTHTRWGGRTLIELNGSFPRGCTQRTALALVDRTELTERLFRGLWQSLGGSWAGRAREAVDPAGSQLLARRASRPWGEVLRHMNKTSDNALTRLLFLQLGVAEMATQPERSTRDLADQRVRQWLAQHGINDSGLVLDNGSGLSRSERITPLQMASALKVAWFGRHAAELQMSLPVAGVDGTMRNRLKDSPATGWARLKTGTLRNVVALAGYVTDPVGWPWAVVMIVNHDNAKVARPVLDALVDSIARQGPHGAAPQPR
jgi:D-alanyl-D-alanine carboxypeptidase/D-alanyl-D-alanine-endopeptidase (penicillin-binding protein 4)